MAPGKLTLVQSFKVLWSFIWRTWILMIPLVVVMMGAMFFLMPFPKPGEVAPPPEPKQAVIILLLWVVMMVGMLVLQAVGLRWALGAKWKGFRLEVRTDSET